MSVALSQNDAAAPAARTDSLADTVILLLGLTAVQRLVGFVRSVLFCRWLDPLELGEWDLAFGFLLMASPLVILGLPGTFGRYVEHYRQRGQLRTFLARMTLLTGLLAMLGAGVIAICAGWFSQLVFGRADRLELIWLIAASLGAVISHSFVMELLTALRMFRVVSGLHFAHSLAFALIGTCLLVVWQSSAASIVLAYAAASLMTVLVSALWLRPLWRSLPRPLTNPSPTRKRVRAEPENALACESSLCPAEPLPHSALLAKVLPFAAWVCLTGWLTNMFDLADRYMLIHYSGFDTAEALVQVGNYHSSRVVPLLLVSVAILLANAVLPHMSHDWEAGRKSAVSQRINLMLKLVGFALLFGAAIILLAAPLLFGFAFQGKYSGGLTVLPWTLVYCIWFGLLGIAQSYLWCAEKVRLGSVAVLVGLLVNIGLNMLLLPRLGLQGAVMAMAAANLTTFVLSCCFAHLCGLQVDRGAWLIILLPPLLGLGPWPMLAVLTGLTIWAARGKGLLTTEDRRQLTGVWRDYWGRFRGSS